VFQSIRFGNGKTLENFYNENTVKPYNSYFTEVVNQVRSIHDIIAELNAHIPKNKEILQTFTLPG
jgi:hypothetical protein